MQRFLNNYETTLQTAISDTANAIQVYPSTAFDDVAPLTPGDYYLLTISDGTNIEIVKVTAVSIGPVHILSVDRDVSASGHGSFAFAAGATVKMSVVAETLQALNEVLINADYPPNYTINQQTKSTAGTVSVPFTPLVIQQVNIDVASGVTLNVTPGATWGECIITLYRTNTSYAWPSLTYNGASVFVNGSPAGGYNAKLLCRSEPGAGYLPNPFVTFEWITNLVAADPAYLSPFGASGVGHGIVYSGTTLTIDTNAIGYRHSANFQPNTILSIYPNPPYDYIAKEFFLSSEAYTGIPSVKFMGSDIVPKGTPPQVGQYWSLHGFIWGPSYAEFTWVSPQAVDVNALPFTTERISVPVNLPVIGSGQTLTVNYQNGASTPTSQWATFQSGSSINFYNPGNDDSSAWSGVREFFIIIHALTTAIPAVKLNGVTKTPAGTAPGIIPQPTFGVPISPPAGMLKVTIMLAGSFHCIRAEWVLFQ